MSLKFYTDVHFPKALAEQARLRGIDVVRCQEVGLDNATDEEHLQYAVSEARVLISADTDFRIIHSRWLMQGKHHYGIVSVSQTRKDNIGALLEYIEFLYQAVEGKAADAEKDVYNQIHYF